jgi:DNA-binding NtrC family response regulator
MEKQPLRYQNLNVLVVEDDDSSYFLIEELLIEYNLHLIRATNGEQALVCVNSNLPLYLAILDIKLPLCLDGIQLAHLIRSKRPGLGIIIQSATALTEKQRLDIHTFAYDFFPKPLDLNGLFKAVYRHLEHKLNTEEN